MSTGVNSFDWRLSTRTLSDGDTIQQNSRENSLTQPIYIPACSPRPDRRLKPADPAFERTVDLEAELANLVVEIESVVKRERVNLTAILL